MTLALPFVTPLLLIGVLAAAIPFVLHLLSSVRAQDMMFPTLRFLRMSMEKTARRRRLQHWLLLLLRAGLFTLLALSVAEPLSPAIGGWLGGQSYSAAIVLDNGYSMAVTDKTGSRFERAKADAASLLSGDEKPSMAAVFTTNGGFNSRDLSSGLEELRAGIARARIGYGPTGLAERVRSAVDALANDTASRKAIYVFSDLQRTSFESVSALEDLALAKDIHLLVVDTSRGEVGNVGISDLEVTGRRVVDSLLEFDVTLVNSSPTDKTVDVAMQIDGSGVPRRIRKSLRAAGMDGSAAMVRFHHRFTQPGPAGGKVFLDTADDLALDNVRRFSLTIGGRVRALVVRGEADDTDVPSLQPSAMLRLALEPYEDQSLPWPLRSKIIEIGELKPADLEAADIAFFTAVAQFTPEQAKAVVDFAANGGTVVLFLGPRVDPANYNERFVQDVTAEGGLLPARLATAVGEIGPEAKSLRIRTVAVDHPFFAGLYENHADYLTVLVQRYYKLSPSPRPGRTLIELENGEPLMQLKRFGSGRVVVFTTTASPKWSNLPVTGLFLPIVARMSLLARKDLWRDTTYLAGAQVTIRPDFAGIDSPGPDEKMFVNVTSPTGGAGGSLAFTTVPVNRTPEGYLATYEDTRELGSYTWKLTRSGGGDGPGGSFVVNPYGPECKLEAMPAKTFRAALKSRGLQRVYVAGTLADVHAQAAAESTGRNWWDLLLAAAIIVLVFEAIVANRRSRGEEAVPEHLLPSAAT